MSKCSLMKFEIISFKKNGQEITFRTFFDVIEKKTMLGI